MKPSIRITRYPYEEPYHLNLRIAASNGHHSGYLEYYCHAADLGSLGKQLVDFSGKEKQKIVYELGSEKPEDRFAFFFSLKIDALGGFGHCAVIIRLNNNAAYPEKEVCEFRIKAELADINRLGKLLNEFGGLQHRVLEWNLQDGRLLKEDEASS